MFTDLTFHFSRLCRRTVQINMFEESSVLIQQRIQHKFLKDYFLYKYRRWDHHWCHLLRWRTFIDQNQKALSDRSFYTNFNTCLELNNSVFRSGVVPRRTSPMIHNSGSRFLLVYLLNNSVVYCSMYHLHQYLNRIWQGLTDVHCTLLQNSAATWTFLSGSCNVGLTRDHSNEFPH